MKYRSMSDLLRQYKIHKKQLHMLEQSYNDTAESISMLEPQLQDQILSIQLQELENLKLKMTEYLSDIDNAIELLDDYRTRLVFSYRYVKGLQVNEVAELMGLSTRQVFRITKQGLQELNTAAESMTREEI